MDKIRNEKLYPRLIEITGGVIKAKKLVDNIPLEELTITRALYDACGWKSSGLVELTHADKIAQRLQAAKQNGVDHDGYYIEYYVTFDQCWGGIVQDFADRGLTLTREDDKIRISYSHLPEISISRPNKYAGKKFKPRVDFDFTTLQRKIVGVYGTPFQEEVIALRLLMQLPQPIAEAISDCILGVMERRFIPYCSAGFIYKSKFAFQSELRFTAYPEYIIACDENVISRDWESITNAKIAAEQARRQAWKNVTESDDIVVEDYGDDGW